jgi:hypothetical protein
MLDLRSASKTMANKVAPRLKSGCAAAIDGVISTVFPVTNSR